MSTLIRPRVAALLALTVVVSTSHDAYADVPRLISYQGRLSSGGAGPADLDVRFYNVAVGGAPLFSELHMDVPLNNGVFSVQIGSNTGGGVPDAALNATEVWLGLSVDGAAELTPRTRLVMVPYAAKSAATERLVQPNNFTNIATTDASGRLNFVLDADAMMTAGHNNTIEKRMWIGHSTAFPNWGLQYRDVASDGFFSDTIEFTAGDQTKPRFGFQLLPGNFRIYQADAGELSFEFLGEGGTSSGSRLRMYDDGGDETLDIDGDWFGAGLLQVNDATNAESVRLDGLAGEIWLFEPSGDTFVNLDAGFSQAGAALEMSNASGAETVQLTGGDGSGNAATRGGQLVLRTSGKAFLQNELNENTVEIHADEFGDGDGSTVYLRNSDGITTIELDADFNDGDGRVITNEIQITGGSDLSEQFDVAAHAARAAVAPGMVVCIDPAHVGKLVVSARAYDRTVAGVISGAGGVKPGMLMGQRGTAADGEHPVALTGRVWVACDASSGSIQPGDLLTTSDTPGHAMRVSDHTRAQGAVIGKAMSPLPEGRGLVLVLVSLQ